MTRSSWSLKKRRATILLAVTVLTGIGQVVAAETPTAVIASQWKFSDLVADVTSFDTPSFKRGQRLYKHVKCSACHRMNGDGNEFGPDLTQLGDKWNGPTILKHVLKPSLEINKDFQSHAFELRDGRTIHGLIIAAGPRFLKVIQDPLKSSQATRVHLDAIQNRSKSRTSLMPSDLLNRLRRGEIVDLIAYVNSRGNDRHPSYRRNVE